MLRCDHDLLLIYDNNADDRPHETTFARPPCIPQASVCCNNPTCATWQWANASCGASSGCGCWLGHKNINGAPTGCHPADTWVGGTRVPPDNYPPKPSPPPPAPDAIPPEYSLVWPQPQSQTMGSEAGFLAATPQQFSFVPHASAATSSALQKAFARYEGILFQHPPAPMSWVGRCDAAPCPLPPPPPNRSLLLTALEVSVSSANETLGEDTSERYNLTITFPRARLAADTIYGEGPYGGSKHLRN